MTDQSKQWIITEQGIKEAAAEIWPETGKLSWLTMDFGREDIERERISEIIAAHAQSAPGPSCTLCGSPMAFQCPKCGSTPELTQVAGSPETPHQAFTKWDKSRIGGEGLESAFYAGLRAAAAPPQGTPTPDFKALCEMTARILLQHINDEDYEMSLAGLVARLTEHTL